MTAETGRDDELPVLSTDRVESLPRDGTEEIGPPRADGMLPESGSAGGIAALQAFFRAMPADSGMAFIVILHLSPEHESTLRELLQRTTAMRVVPVLETEWVEPNCVYVIPPGRTLSSIDGMLRLSELPAERGRRVAVDLFFRMLADTHGPHAVAIVLSGADCDGAIGIKRIKEHGGLTIAQDPLEAEHCGMTRSAIATGVVDWVLEVEQKPGWSIRIAVRGSALCHFAERPVSCLLPV